MTKESAGLRSTEVWFLKPASGFLLLRSDLQAMVWLWHWYRWFVLCCQGHCLHGDVSCSPDLMSCVVMSYFNLEVMSVCVCCQGHCHHGDVSK